MMTNEQQEQAIRQIMERNRRVEFDKAWERSWTRRILIALITYGAALAWLELISEPSAWWKAFVPLAGYVLSTLSLPPLKAWWLKQQPK